MENLIELDYLTFKSGEVINEVLSVKGVLIQNARFNDEGFLVCDTLKEGVGTRLDLVLDNLKCSPELRHSIYSSILKKVK
jgi:hypothetical protein